AFVADIGVDHESAPHDRRSPAATTGAVTPENAAGACVEGEKTSVPGRQEELPVRHGRRELEQRRVVVERPDAAEWRSQSKAGISRAGEIEAVARPRDTFRRPGRLRLRRHELDGGGTVDVAKLVPSMEHERGQA